MARRRSSAGGGILIVVVAIIAILARIPKEIWVLVAVVVAAVFIIRALTKKTDTHSSISIDLSSSTPRRTASNRTGSSQSIVSVPTRPSQREYTIPPRPAAEAAFRYRWVPAGETVGVADLTIPGGMIYVGLNLRAKNERQEPALINPNLKVARGPVDISVRRTPYWPSYSEIDPEARRAYLQWLASGRRDPSADIGYVFLFFYGLERRVLLDLQSAAGADDELQTIKREVRELLDAYGNNGSFHMYASGLLNYLDVTGATSNLQPAGNIPQERRGYELPLSFKVQLAKFAVARTPVPEQWALQWALVDPMIVCRTPVQRCRTEFEQLFPEYYGNQCGPGIVLPINKTKLKVSYRPASGAFAGQTFTVDVGGLPDVTAIGGPQKKLQAVVDACTTELDRYSRLLGKSPEKKDSIEATLLLPISAWPAAAQSALNEIDEELKHGETTATWEGLLARFGAAPNVSRPNAVLFAKRLEERGIGIEPDLIGGSKLPVPSEAIVLFASPKREEKVAEGAYATAVLMIDLGAMMAAADGEVSEHEFDSLRKTIDAWEHLDNHYNARLAAHLQLQISHPPATNSLKKRVEMLSAEARRTVADILVSTARADGSVTPDEVRLLEKLYKLLQLDPKQVYRDLHEEGESTTTPTTGFVLDPARIARLQSETEHISAVLKEVFTDDAEVEPAAEAPEPTNAAAENFLGLDAEHSGFARLVLSRPQWSRADLADAASDMELMLDGALERINEAAIDKFESPITEGDDPVEVNIEVAEKVFA